MSTDENDRKACEEHLQPMEKTIRVPTLRRATDSRQTDNHVLVELMRQRALCGYTGIIGWFYQVVVFLPGFLSQSGYGLRVRKEDPKN